MTWASVSASEEHGPAELQPGRAPLPNPAQPCLQPEPILLLRHPTTHLRRAGDPHGKAMSRPSPRFPPTALPSPGRTQTCPTPVPASLQAPSAASVSEPSSSSPTLRCYTASPSTAFAPSSSSASLCG